MAHSRRPTRFAQLLTILGYQTLAMGFMLLGASFLADWSVADDAAVQTAATPECSRPDSTAPTARLPVDFLDLTVAWVFD